MFRTKHTDHRSGRSNLAARMGRWSAAHWKTATFGWLAFVVVAFGLGGAVGMKTIDQNDARAGRVRPRRQDPRRRVRAARRRERPDPEPHAARRAIPRSRRPSRTSSPGSPGSTSSSTSARRSLPRTPARSPPDRHAALVEFEIRGDPDKAVDKIGPVLDRVDELQAAHPELFIGEFGDASKVDALVDAPTGTTSGRPVCSRSRSR